MAGLTLPAVPAFVDPLEMTAPIDGVDVVIRPADMNQIIQVASKTHHLLEVWLSMAPERRVRFTDGAPTAEDVDVMLNLAQGHMGVPCELVAILLRQPVTWVESLLPDRFAYLFCCVVMVNADFFSRSRRMLDDVVTSIEGVRSQATGMDQPSGENYSGRSSLPGTPTGT